MMSLVAEKRGPRGGSDFENQTGVGEIQKMQRMKMAEKGIHLVMRKIRRRDHGAAITG